VIKSLSSVITDDISLPACNLQSGSNNHQTVNTSSHQDNNHILNLSQSSFIARLAHLSQVVLAKNILAFAGQNDCKKLYHL